MRIIRTAVEMRDAVEPARNDGAVVGLVPTMGALHAGHLALVRRARRDCGLVVVSLFVASSGGLPYADPLFAIAIVLYMGVGSWRIAATSIDDLMDREFPDEDRIKIREIAIQHPRVRDVHDMRTRSSGPYSFIQIHLEMDKMLTLNEAHEISDDVMYKVEREFPNAEVLIHLDPEGIEERRDEL